MCVVEMVVVSCKRNGKEAKNIHKNRAQISIHSRAGSVRDVRTARDFLIRKQLVAHSFLA